MRVAALYDIHGNLPALEAVLYEVRQAADFVVVGGDVLPGPMPRDTLELLLTFEIPTRFIYGNGEVAVLEQMAGRENADVPEQFRPAIRWTAAQLGSQHKQQLESWPRTLQMEIPGLGDVLFCHATPRNENESFTRLTLETRLEPAFEGVSASLVVCGHTHMQFDRMIGRVRVVNAGSVGMPFGKPGAHWVLLGPDVQFRHTLYDLEQAAMQIRDIAYPQAQQFAADNVLHPPSEAQMLERFAQAESIRPLKSEA